MSTIQAQEKPLSPSEVRRNRVQTQRLRAQSLEIAEDLKLGIMSADRDKKVAKLLDHMLDKGVRLKDIKGSDALNAAKMYADRRWPLRQDNTPPVHVFVKIDLSEFRTDPLKSAKDITPTTICSDSEGGKSE